MICKQVGVFILILFILFLKSILKNKKEIKNGGKNPKNKKHQPKE